MKNFSKIWLLLAILFSFSQLQSQPEKAKKALSNAVQSANSTGRLFYIAIPPNDIVSQPTQALDIFVSSSYDTKVTLSNPVTGLYIIKKVAKNKVTSFSNTDGDIDWGRDEIRISQNAQGQGMRLESDDPICVYVMNSKMFTTDGYLAIPVALWGTRYINLSFWDFAEFGPWAGGFIVLAAEDNTKVTIQLKGRGAGFATTDRGSKIGQTLRITLNKGEVYMVRGDAKTRGVFDLSGSEINSNKKVGLISCHERCMIPVTILTNGRDHLSEMMPPVSAWGLKYYTVEIDRGKDMGDYFRAIASEDNTTVHVRWYDKKTKNLLGEDTRILKKAGDFEEFNDIQAEYPSSTPSVRGTSSFEFDKPGLVMQYCFSANWDGGNGWWDPFMTLVVPKEQFTTGTVFQSPANRSGNEYNNNFFNIIAVGDTVDQANNQKLLSSIILDGKKIVNLASGFVGQQIPKTDLFWAAVQIEKGTHQIFGNTPFGGYVYGYSNADSYGWPAATAFRRVGQNDTLSPVCVPKGECGEYIVHVTELRDGKEGDDPRQIDTGVEFTPTMSSDTSRTYNFVDTVFIDDAIKFLPAEHSFDFKVKVKDKYADGLITLTATDAVGNDTIFTIRYEADSIIIKPNPVDFKFQRVGTTSPEMLVTLFSKSDSLITIKSIKLKDGKVFNITDGNQPDPNGVILLPPRSTKIIKLTYSPVKEYIELNPKYDLDSLIIETKCLIHKFPVIGRGVLPRIFVEDWDAGTVATDENRCKKSFAGSGLLIRNDGTDTLVVSAIDQTDAQLLPFSMSSQATINLKFPFKLAPGAKANLEDICIMSPVIGQFTKNVKFITNNAIGKDISVWKANVVKPLLTITSEVWGPVRVKSTNTTNGLNNKGLLIIKNLGTSPVDILSIKLENTPDNNFKILPNRFSNGKVTVFQKGDNSADTMITIPIEYTPQTVGNQTNGVICIVDPVFNVPDGSVKGILNGISYLPEISVSSYTFTPACLVNTDHQTSGVLTEGSVTITNTTKTTPHDLSIYGITPRVNTADYFEIIKGGKSWVRANANNPIVIAPNLSEVLYFKFRPTASGLRTITFDVSSDAGEQLPNNTAPTNIINTDGKVFGVGFMRGATVNNVDLGNVLLCNNKSDIIRIKNTSDTEVLTVDSVRFISGDDTAFRLLGGVNPNGKVIAANGELQLTYGLTGKSGNITNTYRAYLSDGLGFKDYTVKANIYKVPIRLSTNEFQNISPGISYQYPVNIEFLTQANSPNVFTDGLLDYFEVTLRVKKTWMTSKVNSTITVLQGNALPGAWTLTPIQIIDPLSADYVLMQVVAKSNSGQMVDKNGVLFNLVVSNLLSETGEFTPQISNIVFGNTNIRLTCIDSTTSLKKITYSVCAQPIRVVETGLTYSLSSISPNPISASTFELKFGVGVESFTRIEIVNMQGQVIAVPVNEMTKSGVYTTQVNTDMLSSGIYRLRMTSGFFSKDTDLIITK
ncbi:MAG: T9SS type A sorting domain-containing protein [Candidatus Kapabacteria bacterium]|nr:T9SS type A sorting domain-containing protein [Candidatus Kapabacteria bacterium]